MDNKPKYRLGWFAIVVMIILAGIADLVTLIPIAGDIVGPLFWICMNIFLYTKGFGIVNGRRLTTSLISMVAEMIPVVQEFPLIIAGTIVLVVFSRLEDKTGLTLTKGKAGLKNSAANALNKSGRREPNKENEQVPDNMEQLPYQNTGTRNPNTQPLQMNDIREAA